MVSDSKGIFKCFGCGKGGDVISFAMEYERLEFVDALKYLADYAHIETDKYPKFTSDPAIKHSKEQTKSLNQIASSHFESNLQTNPSAMEYLHKRNLDDQTIKHFQLGYALDGYYDMINYLKKHGFTTEQILESALCKVGPSGDLYDFFRKRVIFPIQDALGNIVAFTGRVLDPQDSPKYLNISNTTLYDKSKVLYGMNFMKKNIGQFDKIIVVEGNMDVIALHRIGLPIGVATCGTSLTEDHVKTLKRHTDNVYLLFDNDDAGFGATVRGMKLAYAQDLYPQVLQLHNTNRKDEWTIKDVDDFANAWWTAEELLNTAIDWLSYIIHHLKIQYSLNNPVNKKKVINTLFEIIRSINDLSITQHYLHEVATHTDISEEVLMSQYKMRYRQNKFKLHDQKKEQWTKSGLNTKQLVDVLVVGHTWKEYVDEPKELEDTISLYSQLNSLSQSHQTTAEEIIDQDSGLLRRDHELALMDNAKKTQFIKNIITKLIDELLKQIMKTSLLTSWEKSALLEQRNKIRN